MEKTNENFFIEIVSGEILYFIMKEDLKERIFMFFI